MPRDQSETSCSDPIVAGQPSEAGELLRPDRGGDLDGASENMTVGQQSPEEFADNGTYKMYYVN